MAARMNPRAAGKKRQGRSATASSPLYCPVDGGFHRDLQQRKKTQAVDFKPFLSFSDLLSAFPFSRSVSFVDLFFFFVSPSSLFQVAGGKEE